MSSMDEEEQEEPCSSRAICRVSGTPKPAPTTSPSLHDMMTANDNLWCICRIWGKGIYESLQEHLASGNHLHSRLSLSRLFLHTMGFWEKDYRYRTPTSRNFRKVLVGKIRKLNFDEDDDQLLIRVAELECADALGAGKKSNRIILESNGDLAHVLQNIVVTGDILVIFGDCGRKVVSGIDVMLLNDNRDLLAPREDLHILHYRHDGKFTMPLNDNGEPNSTYATEAYYERDVENGVVQVQHILPQRSVGSKYKISSEFRILDSHRRSTSESTSPLIVSALESSPQSTNGTSKFPVREKLGEGGSPSCKQRKYGLKNSSSAVTASELSEESSIDVDPSDYVESGDEDIDNMSYEDTGPIELVDLADSEDDGSTIPATSITESPAVARDAIAASDPNSVPVTSPTKNAIPAPEPLVLDSRFGEPRDVRSSSEISEGVISAMEGMLRSISGESRDPNSISGIAQIRVEDSENAETSSDEPTNKLRLPFKVGTPSSSTNGMDSEVAVDAESQGRAEAITAPSPPRRTQSANVVETIWNELEEMFSDDKDDSSPLPKKLTGKQAGAEGERLANSTVLSGNSSISVYADALASPSPPMDDDDSRYITFAERSSIDEGETTFAGKSGEFEMPFSPDGSTASSTSDVSYSDFEEKGLVQLFDLLPDERTLFTVNCHILSILPSRRGGAEFFMRIEDGTVPGFPSKRFITPRLPGVSTVHSEPGFRGRSEDIVPLSEVDIQVRRGSELYATAEQYLGKLVTLTNVALNYNRRNKFHYFAMNGTMSTIALYGNTKTGSRKKQLHKQRPEPETAEDYNQEKRKGRKRYLGEDADSDGSNTSDRRLPFSSKDSPFKSPRAKTLSASKYRTSSAKKPRWTPASTSKTNLTSPSKAVSHSTSSSKTKKGPSAVTTDKENKNNATEPVSEQNRSARRKLEYPCEPVPRARGSVVRASTSSSGSRRWHPRFLIRKESTDKDHGKPPRRLFPASRYIRLKQLQVARAEGETMKLGSSENSGSPASKKRSAKRTSAKSSAAAKLNFNDVSTLLASETSTPEKPTTKVVQRKKRRVTTPKSRKSTGSKRSAAKAKVAKSPAALASKSRKTASSSPTKIQSPESEEEDEPEVVTLEPIVSPDTETDVEEAKHLASAGLTPPRRTLGQARNVSESLARETSNTRRGRPTVKKTPGKTDGTSLASRVPRKISNASTVSSGETPMKTSNVSMTSKNPLRKTRVVSASPVKEIPRKSNVPISESNTNLTPGKPSDASVGTRMRTRKGSEASIDSGRTPRKTSGASIGPGNSPRKGSDASLGSVKAPSKATGGSVGTTETPRKANNSSIASTAASVKSNVATASSTEKPRNASVDYTNTGVDSITSPRRNSEGSVASRITPRKASLESVESAKSSRNASDGTSEASTASTEKLSSAGSQDAGQRKISASRLLMRVRPGKFRPANPSPATSPPKTAGLARKGLRVRLRRK